jgi:hypothetical protein
MRPPAHLIIPLFYAEKLVSMTLPALLAPGNIPSPATMFDMEVLVTEHKFVDYTPARLLEPASQLWMCDARLRLRRQSARDLVHVAA